jgi:hypothetical protein
VGSAVGGLPDSNYDVPKPAGMQARPEAGMDSVRINHADYTAQINGYRLVHASLLT